MSGTDETIYVCQCAKSPEWATVCFLWANRSRQVVGVSFNICSAVESICMHMVSWWGQPSEFQHAGPSCKAQHLLLSCKRGCSCHFLCYKHTQETHTQNTPWPPADCVWTPGQDLEASRIPAGWELNSLDYPTIHRRVHQHVTSHPTSVTFKCTHSNRNGCKDMKMYVFKHWRRIKK